MRQSESWSLVSCLSTTPSFVVFYKCSKPELITLRTLGGTTWRSEGRTEGPEVHRHMDGPNGKYMFAFREGTKY